MPQVANIRISELAQEKSRTAACSLRLGEKREVLMPYNSIANNRNSYSGSNNNNNKPCISLHDDKYSTISILTHNHYQDKPKYRIYLYLGIWFNEILKSYKTQVRD